MIATLINERFLMLNESDKTYSLGISVYKLGKCATNSMAIQKVAQPFLKELADDLSVTTHLAVYDNDLVNIVAKVLPENASYVLNMKSVEGGTLPYHCTGMGKLFLASISQKKARKILESAGMYKHTKNTVTNIDELLSLLPAIDKQGFATTVREHEEYTAGIACPVFDGTGRMCCSISAGGICEMFTDIGMENIAEKVKQTAISISRVLGYPPVC